MTHFRRRLSGLRLRLPLVGQIMDLEKSLLIRLSFNMGSFMFNWLTRYITVSSERLSKLTPFEVSGVESIMHSKSLRCLSTRADRPHLYLVAHHFSTPTPLPQKDDRQKLCLFAAAGYPDMSSRPADRIFAECSSPKLEEPHGGGGVRDIDAGCFIRSGLVLFALPVHWKSLPSLFKPRNQQCSSQSSCTFIWPLFGFYGEHFHRVRMAFLRRNSCQSAPKLKVVFLWSAAAISARQSHLS